MSAFKRSQIVVVLGAFLVVVLLLLAPKTPSNSMGEMALHRSGIDVESLDSVEAKIVLTTVIADRLKSGQMQSQQGMPQFMVWVKKLKALSNKYPENYTAYMSLGGFEEERGRLDTALIRYSSAARVADNLAQEIDAMYHLSEVYVRKGEVNEAITLLSVAIKKGMKDIDAAGELRLFGIQERIKELKNSLKN